MAEAESGVVKEIAVGESPQSQGFDVGYGRGAGRAVGHDAGQVWDLGQPASVGFSLYLNLHSCSSLSSRDEMGFKHVEVLPCSGRMSSQRRRKSDVRYQMRDER